MKTQSFIKSKEIHNGIIKSGFPSSLIKTHLVAQTPSDMKGGQKEVQAKPRIDRVTHIKQMLESTKAGLLRKFSAPEEQKN